MFDDLITEARKRRIRRLLLDLDAWLDSRVFGTGSWLRHRYERFSGYMDRYYVFGWRRVLVEILSELFTVGTAASLLTFMLAVPAFQKTSDPNWLKPTNISVTFLDRYGKEIGHRGIHSTSLPLDDYPPQFIQALIATEDRRFYDHFGIDMPGIARALVADLSLGGVVQGGSSITQQLAKNLFLGNERTVNRKINEAFLAIWLESRLTKAEILKLYLDRAYLGRGNFGAEAAAQYYFGKSPQDLNLAEAAMLAGMFKAPTKFAPDVNLPAARARADVVLDNLVASGFMNAGQVFGARQEPATPIDHPTDPVAEDASYNYYLDWAFEETRRLVQTFPSSVTDRKFVVRTAIDMNLQHATEDAIRGALEKYGDEYHASQAAAVLIDVDGNLRAMVGGRDYGESQFNRAVDALRQPGSSFKPYVYATALANGMTPRSIVVDEPICLGSWCAQNDNHSYAGSMTLTQALADSVNTVAIRLSIMIGQGDDKLGRSKIIDTARKMGVRGPLRNVPSLPIGADAVKVLDHTAAYATFPNLGKAVPTHAIIDVRTPNGSLVWNFERDGKKPEQVISKEIAIQMTQMMNKVIADGTGRHAALDSIPAAGKTGTTNSYRDAWFVGYTGNYVCGVWFGNDDFSPTNRMTGGSVPAIAWRNIMTAAHRRTLAKDLAGLPSARSAYAMVSMDELNAELAAHLVLSGQGASVLHELTGLMEQARHGAMGVEEKPGLKHEPQGPKPPPPAAQSSSVKPEPERRHRRRSAHETGPSRTMHARRHRGHHGA